MRPLVYVLLAVALVVAVVTAVLAKRYVARSVSEEISQHSARTAVATTPVLVATRDIPLGRVLASGDIRWQEWPEALVGSSYIRRGAGEDPTERFVGAVARTAIVSGEPIQSNRVFRQEEAGVLAGALSPGMRAMAITVSEEKGAAGFILPGDRVDIILTYEVHPPQGQPQSESTKVAKYTSETVLQDVRVLGVDQTLGGVKENSVKAKTVTLELTAKQAETMA
ncbi:MAG: Flp pilus assembly protein CpaB, partial [Alphaproteobacteria bacterium]